MERPRTPTARITRSSTQSASPNLQQNQLQDGFRILVQALESAAGAGERAEIIKNIAQFARVIAAENDVAIQLPLDTSSGIADNPTKPSQSASDSGGSKTRKSKEKKSSKTTEATNDGDIQLEDEEDEGDDEVAPENKKPEPKLASLTLAISSDVDTTELYQMRQRFFQDLLSVKVKGKVNNSTRLIRFTETDAIEVTNFFFNEMMGPSALNRLTNLIKLYTTKEEGGLDMGAGARAARLIHEKDTPLAIRVFFGAFSKAQTSRSNSLSVFAAIQQTITNLELLDRFEALRERVQARDPVVLKFLEENGFCPRKGVDWKSCMIKYLSSSLQISPTILQNTCQSAQGIAGLIEQFGQGIIVILPISAMNRLNRLGNQRMLQVYPLLRRHVACFQPVCDLLERHVLKPIQEGKPLGLQTLRGGKSGSLMERIIQAVNQEDE